MDDFPKAQLPLNKQKEVWGISGLSESAAMKNDYMYLMCVQFQVHW